MAFKLRLNPLIALSLSTSLLLPNLALAQSSKELIQQAQQAQNQGNFLQAEDLWRRVVQLNPTALNYYNLGLSLQQQLKLSEAIKAYEQAIKIDPRLSSAHLNLGIALLDARNDIQAERAFRQVLALPNQPANPASTHTLAYYDLAIIYKRQGKLEQARQEVRQALALTPSFAPAQQLLKQL
jgi:superkiller protein 3